MSPTLNLAHAGITADSNGPGRRFTIWVQGCSLDCPGCFNPGLQPQEPRREMHPAELAREALDARPWEGVSLSGGEPFLQAGSLALLLDELRRRVEPFTVIAFTGYRIGELRRRGGDAAALLARVDLLVDGRFRQERAAQLPLRGSRNQRLRPLTAEGAALRERIERHPPGGCEVQIGERGEVILTGFPPAELVRQAETWFRPRPPSA